MRYCMQTVDAVVEGDGDGVETHMFFGPDRACSEFDQRLLRFGEPSDDRRDEQRDEVLYVLGGSGSATFGEERRTLAPGTAAYVARGTSWRVDDANGLDVLSVLVRDPLPAGGTPHAVVELAAEETKGATSGRQFRLLATPAVGCASVTQFVGYIPVGRAPDHFHTYDEVVYVLEGEGSLHIGGESAPLRPGSCVHLPARLVHCLQNDGPGVMQVLGVFRPAGSPAEAYYPDGTPAALPQEA
ncbi:MAG TPA: cupin domain-containing protein [Gaiellaceae bacterium]|nr:cupin domain-containing protein [Gaiellaceae bacterium]